MPFCFSAQNTKHLFQARGPRLEYLAYTCGIDGGSPSYAPRCRNCGNCEMKCPQHLPIRRHLREAARELQGWYFTGAGNPQNPPHTETGVTVLPANMPQCRENIWTRVGVRVRIGE